VPLWRKKWPASIPMKRVLSLGEAINWGKVLKEFN
jgi:hypothetical protein